MKHINTCARAIIILLVVFAVPASVHASLQITEIMYDVSGSDSGREWIEVTNTGSVAEDVSEYKLFEDTTGHSIAVISGSATLSPGSAGIIVTDQAKFGADWPAYTGPLYKSSFSLSNTGEALGLKDAVLALVDSISYSSELGAQGDGLSLLRSGATLVAGTPTPGSYSGNIRAPSSAPTPTPTPTSQPNIPATTQHVTSSVGGSETLTVTITTQPVVVAGGGSFFSGTASDSKGLKANVRYIWNFGDGRAAEGNNVFHAYTYPGTYVVTLTAAAGEEAGMGRVTVHTVAPAIGMLVQNDGSVVISNQSSQEINIGLWSIASGASAFPFPQETILLGNQSLRFSPNLMQFVAGPDTALRYPNGAIVTSAVQTPIQIETVEPSQQQLSKKSSDLLPLVGQTFFQDVAAAVMATSGVAATALVMADSNSADGGESLESSQATEASRPRPATAGSRGLPQEPHATLEALIVLLRSLPLWTWILGGVGLLLIAIGALPYMLSVRAKKPLETHVPEEEFKIE